MSKIQINYIESRSKEAGCFQISDGSPVPSDRDRKTLLHLLFWLTYTREGRDFLSANRTRDGKKTPEDVTEALTQKFRDEFGIINDGLLHALIEAHLAADRYVGAQNKMPSAAAAGELEKQTYVYQQNMSFVMWSLWEDAMGQDFSMNW